jgi:hypothetical protein
MAENFDLIFGQSASTQYAWSDSDYQNGWETVGSTPPTAEQFDALQRRADTKAKELNDRLTPLETNNTNNYRQPSTYYDVGDIAFNPDLPTGYYLEGSVAGTTSSGTLTIPSTITPNVTTISDGTVVWTVRIVTTATQFNTKNTYTTSGSFVAPVSGTYRIVLQGGGGGGSGAGYAATHGNYSGGGGGQGGHLEFYEKLTAGTSYSYTIGAGGAGGAAGSSSTAGAEGNDGGNSQLTIGANSYVCKGGKGGADATICVHGGGGGTSTINDVNQAGGTGAPGAPGGTSSKNAGTTNACTGGGSGGGPGGGRSLRSSNGVGSYGGGGSGGMYFSGSEIYAGSAGGDGYICFEYCSA